MTALRTGKTFPGATTVAVLVALSVLLGRAMVETQQIHTAPATIALVILSAAAAVALMCISPVVCIGLAIGFTIVRVVPLQGLGGLNFGAGDAFYLGLVTWWLADVWRERLHPREEQASDVPFWPVAVFLGWVAFTIVWVATLNLGGDPGQSLVALGRLVQTVTLGIFAARYIRTSRDLRTLLGMFAFAVAVMCVLSLRSSVSQQPGVVIQGHERGSDLIDPNALGLAAGLVLLMAVFPALSTRLWVRVLLAGIGAWGLFDGQSIGSIAGTSVAIAVGLALLVRNHRRAQPLVARLFTAVAAIILAVAVAYGVASVIRPANLPGSQNFTNSSTYHRAIVAAGGVELAKENPLIGVGWRRSGAPDEIGSTRVTRELRAEFPNARNVFFPDVNPTSVHNTYVEVIAELGAIGLAIFLFMLVWVGRGVARAVSRSRSGTQARTELWYLAFGLVLILVWLNENALYGGQIETVVGSVVLGAIAGRAAGLRAEERRDTATPPGQETSALAYAGPERARS